MIYLYKIRYIFKTPWYKIVREETLKHAFEFIFLLVINCWDCILYEFFLHWDTLEANKIYIWKCLSHLCQKPSIPSETIQAPWKPDKQTISSFLLSPSLYNSNCLSSPGQNTEAQISGRYIIPHQNPCLLPVSQVSPTFCTLQN